MSALSLATGEGARGELRWGISFAIICALHLGAAALLWRSHIFVVPSEDIPPNTVLIDLPPAPTPPAVAAPPPPPPPPEPEEVKEEPPPPPVKAEVELPKPPPRKPTPPRREKIEPAPHPTPAPVTAAPQLEAKQMPQAQAASVPSVDPILTWEHRLLVRMQSFLQYPRRAMLRRQDGIAFVRIVVDRSGNLISSELQRSSGIPLLDDEAVAVVVRAKPYPPPPPEVPGAQIVRVVPVRFILR